MRRAGGLGLVALVSLVLGCDGEPEAPQPDSGLVADAGNADGSAVDAAAPVPTTPFLELATGRPGDWAPFEDGDVVRLQRGCQGSQHVFVSARTHGAAAGPIVISLAIHRVSDGVLVTAPFELRLPFGTEVARGVREETGLMPVVLRASTVLDQEVFIDGAIVDSEGRRAEARRRALVQWGPDDCG